MEKEYILLTEYCANSGAELEFMLLLAQEGLIDIETRDEIRYLLLSQLGEMELFIRLHYDLSINVEGIDVIHNLLQKMQLLEQEVAILRRNQLL